MTYRSLDDLKAAVAGGDFVSALHWLWALGEAQVGTSEQLSNGLIPEWNPKKVIDIVAP